MSKPLAIPRNVMEPFYWSESVFRKIFNEDVNKIVLGGGTVLTMHWEHRTSTDLDYFSIEPNLVKARELINRAREPLRELQAKGKIQDLEEAAYHLKFFIYGTETTLFTTQSTTLEPATHHEKHSGLKLENTAEILVRKISGRILSLGDFTIRDFYDFCVACHKEPEAFDKALRTTSESEIETIVHELKRWRSPDIVKEAIKGKQLIEPRYQDIANNLWSYAETALRTRTLPGHLFELSDGKPGAAR